jgi:hypothetical protein
VDHGDHDCPSSGDHGSRVFSLGDFFLMDARGFCCWECDGMVVNSWPRIRIPTVAGFAIFSTMWLWAPRPVPALFALPIGTLAIVTMTLGRALIARPIAIVPKPHLCQSCGRDDVGYFNPGDDICAECTEGPERLREIYANLNRIFGDDPRQAGRRLARIPMTNAPETLALLRTIPAGTTVKGLPGLARAFRDGHPDFAADEPT